MELLYLVQLLVLAIMCSGRSPVVAEGLRLPPSLAAPCPSNDLTCKTHRSPLASTAGSDVAVSKQGHEGLSKLLSNLSGKDHDDQKRDDPTDSKTSVSQCHWVEDDCLFNPSFTASSTFPKPMTVLERLYMSIASEARQCSQAIDVHSCQQLPSCGWSSKTQSCRQTTGSIDRLFSMLLCEGSMMVKLEICANGQNDPTQCDTDHCSFEDGLCFPKEIESYNEAALTATEAYAHPTASLDVWGHCDGVKSIMAGYEAMNMCEDMIDEASCTSDANCSWDASVDVCYVLPDRLFTLTYGDGPFMKQLSASMYDCNARSSKDACLASQAEVDLNVFEQYRAIKSYEDAARMGSVMIQRDDGIQSAQ